MEIIELRFDSLSANLHFEMQLKPVEKKTKNFHDMVLRMGFTYHNVVIHMKYCCFFINATWILRLKN